MPATIIDIKSHDAQYTYTIAAQVIGPQEASISERKTDKATGAVTNAKYPITNISVVNGVLKGIVHLLGGLTQNFSLEPSPAGDQPTETIETGGFMFGFGAQKLGPFPVEPADYAQVADWMTNFPHS